MISGLGKTMSFPRRWGGKKFRQQVNFPQMKPRHFLIIGLILAFLTCVLCQVQVYGQGSRGSGPKADQNATQALRDVSRSFQASTENRAGATYYVVALALLGILIAGLVYLDARYRRFQKEGYDNPEMLFRELCTAHQLTKLERGLLKDIASELSLENALPLFADPKYFLHALTESYFAESRKTIKYLLGKFFDIHSEKDPRFKLQADESLGAADWNTTMIYPAQRD